VTTSALKQMVGFGLTMVVLGATTLMAIPALVRSGGASAWSAIAVGQSVGALGAVVLAYGWVISGPADVARMDAMGRRMEYFESLRARFVLCFPVLVVSGVVSLLVARNDQALAALGSVTTAAIGMTSSWYFVGTGEPYRLLLFETLPRAAGTVAGIVLMEAGSSPAVGLVCQIVGLAIGVAGASAFVLRRRRKSDGPRRARSVTTILVDQRHGVATSAWGTLYSVLPIAIVGWVASPVLVQYAVLDKLQKQASSGLSPLVQVLQGWVPRAKPQNIGIRAVRAAVAAIAIGFSITLALILVGRPIVTWLGDGRVHVSLLSISLLAGTVALALVGSVISKASLVSLGLISLVSRLTMWTSMFGLLLVALLGWRYGLDGALVGLLCGSACRCGLLLTVLILKCRESASFSSEFKGLPSLDGKHVDVL